MTVAPECLHQVLGRGIAARPFSLPLFTSRLEDMSLLKKSVSGWSTTLNRGRNGPKSAFLVFDRDREQTREGFSTG